MNRLNEHRALTRFDVHVAKRAQRHPSAGIKRMEQPLGGLLAELLLDHEKHVRRHRLELKMSPISDTKTTIGFFGATAFQRLSDQTTLGRQRLMCTRSDFANRHGGLAGTVPSDHVPAIRDVHLSVVRASLDSACPMDRVQLRVERTAKDVEGKFGDFGANREHRLNSGNGGDEAWQRQQSG